MTLPARTLITSGLPYSNGRLHVGHVAGALLPADIYTRFMRLNGVDARSICGSDDHGVAIMLSAQKEGKTPAEVSRYYWQKQKDDLHGLGIDFDNYSSTSRNPFHAKASQDFFMGLYRQGYFEKKSTRQFYDPERQVFLPDRFVKGVCGYCGAADQNSDQCEQCGQVLDVEMLRSPCSVISGKPATVRETVHWFLDLSRFSSDVAAWLKRASLREHTRGYVETLLAGGLVSRSMTRDIDWGIPVPLDDPDARGKVLYVWFDAPIGYISNTMELCQERDGSADRYADWWKSPQCPIVHFIGEDNTIFHCIIWIAMLKAQGGFQLPSAVVVNQFLNIQFPGQEVEKMSKSRGAAIWIGDYLAAGSNPDSLRYYLTINAPERSRAVYRPEDVVQRHNSELANILGNFVHRIISFTRKYCGPEVPQFSATAVGDIDRKFESALLEAGRRANDEYTSFNFRGALEGLMEFSRICNKYVDDKAPWNTRKTDMEATKVTLAYALRAIRFLAVALTPIMPFACERIQKMLCLPPEECTWMKVVEPLEPGVSLQEPEILFSKIE